MITSAENPMIKPGDPRISKNQKRLEKARVTGNGWKNNLSPERIKEIEAIRKKKTAK